MNLILLKDFNNYFDRIIFKFDELSEYLQNVEYQIIENVNFYENDGLDTEHVFNFKKDYIPNYLLAVENNRIISKWFIIEWRLIRKHQYHATLRRDILAEKFDTIKDVPMFIEKGMPSIDDPLIFNSEGMTYNQIKKKEVLLKDKTDISWLVGYVQQKDFEDGQGKPEDKVVDAKFSRIEGVEPALPISEVPEQILINMNETDNKITFSGGKYEFSLLCKPDKQFAAFMENVIPAEFTAYMDINNSSAEKLTIDYVRYDEEQLDDFQLKKFIKLGEGSNQQKKLMPYFDNLVNNNKGLIDAMYRNIYYQSPFKNSISPETLSRFENKIVEDTDGKQYVLKFVPVETQTIKLTYSPYTQYATHLKRLIKEAFPDVNVFIGDSNKQVVGYFKNTAKAYKVVAVPFNDAEDNLTVTLKNTRNHCNDAPYDVFAIPFDKKLIKSMKFNNGNIEIDNNSALALAMTRGLIAQLGGTGTTRTFIYDVQLLPYCPIPQLINAYDIRGYYDIKDGFVLDKDYSIIYRKGQEGNTPVSIMFWATNIEGTFEVPFNWDKKTTVLDKKIENETSFIRLCSPNYSGVFEFSPTKNDGINHFKVDYTLKPFNPYIHIAPNFGGLYGEDYNDSRGLICGGDFSIASLTDEWARYELNNKNYQQMFDREIKNMDVNNKIALDSQLESGLINTATSVVGGAGAGALVGGPVGAVIGGAAMGIASGVGLARDIDYTKRSQKENRSFKVDMYNYSLGNIRALPQGLAKTTPYTFNNKVFPFIEVYDSTQKEKEILTEKIRYNGMTIMAIGTISDYLGSPNELTFIKGQLIRSRLLGEDFHMVDAIYEELNKGVYIYE